MEDPPGWMCDLSEGDLKEMCATKGLKKTGNRTALLGRLMQQGSDHSQTSKRTKSKRLPKKSTGSKGTHKTSTKTIRKPTVRASSKQTSGRQATSRSVQGHQKSIRQLKLRTWNIAGKLYEKNKLNTIQHFQEHMVSKSRDITISNIRKKAIFKRVFNALNESSDDSTSSGYSSSGDSSSGDSSSGDYSSSSDEYSSSSDEDSSNEYDDSSSDENDGGK